MVRTIIEEGSRRTENESECAVVIRINQDDEKVKTEVSTHGEVYPDDLLDSLVYTAGVVIRDIREKAPSPGVSMMDIVTTFSENLKEFAKELTCSEAPTEPMEKTDTKVTQYRAGNFLVTVTETEEEFEAWLQHERNNVSIFMFGAPKISPTQPPITEKVFLGMIQSMLPDKIKEYYGEKDCR